MPRIRSFLFLTTLMLGVLMSALDSSVVSLCMPQVVRELHGQSHYSWPFTAYLVASTLTIPLSAAVAAMVGRKKVFAGGVLFFMGASLLCAGAPSMDALVLFRFFQGVGAGILTSTAFTLVSLNFPITDRGKYVAYLSAMFAVASLVGPLAGGLVSDGWGWRWVFLINLPLGGVVLLTLVPGFQGREGGKVQRAGFDGPGALFFTVAVSALVLVLSLGGKEIPWCSWEAAGLEVMAFLGLVVFVFWERKAAHPIIPLTLFGQREFNLAFVSALLGSVLFFAGLVLIPPYLQGYFHWTAAQTGSVITPMVLSFVGATMASGRWIRRIRGYRPVGLAAGAAVALALLVWGIAGVSTFPLGIAVVGVVWAGGLGLGTPVYSVAAQNAHPLHLVGQVNASIQFIRNLGTALGAALVGLGLSQVCPRGAMDLSPDGWVKLIWCQFFLALGYLACLVCFKKGVVLVRRQPSQAP